MIEYPFWFPGPSKIELPDYCLVGTRPLSSSLADWHRDCFVSEDAPKRCAEVFVFGHFRQILSTLTRNGRDPARLRDAENGIVRSVH